MTTDHQPNRFDRYVRAIWERTATPTGLVTVIVLALLVVGVIWFLKIDVAGLFSGWFGS